MAEHMQLATEEGQEMLLEEIPESPSAKPRHWYLAGAGLALLVVLGVAAKVVYRSPETLLQSKNFDINTVQEWEQIPGIDQVVEHAKDLGIEAAVAKSQRPLLRISAGGASLDPHRVRH